MISRWSTYPKVIDQQRVQREALVSAYVRLYYAQAGIEQDESTKFLINAIASAIVEYERACQV